MLAVKRAIASICFILVFLVAFTEVSGILERKSLSGAWNMSVKVNGFYNEPQNTFDILFLVQVICIAQLTLMYLRMKPD